MLSLYSIFTKRVLPSVNQEVWLLSYFNNAYSIILFIPLMVLNGEISVLYNYTNFHSTYFWIQMLIGGICGFAIGYVTSLQIKVGTEDIYEYIDSNNNSITGQSDLTTLILYLRAMLLLVEQSPIISVLPLSVLLFI